MNEALRKQNEFCPLCGGSISGDGNDFCPRCQVLQEAINEQPGLVRRLWGARYGENACTELLPPPGEAELPDVLDARRYRTIDRDKNPWYLSVSELDGRPVEVFASTAFDSDHELQSRIANLTTITRLISMVLRHLSLGEPLSYEKCLKQIQRSSRQKNDLPDMLYGVLSRYVDPQPGGAQEKTQTARSE